jgi:hypothetical protein
MMAETKLERKERVIDKLLKWRIIFPLAPRGRGLRRLSEAKPRLAGAG